MGNFEGYVGIQLWEGQWIDDLVLSLVFALFLLFAYVFHRDFRLFLKMGKDLHTIKARVSLFEEPAGNDRVFQAFMVFQALFLSSIILFETARAAGYISLPGMKETALLFFLLFVIIFVFYELKQLLYMLIGYVFVSEEAYKLWKTGYNAVIGIWGVLLYIPTCMLIFSGISFQVSILLSLFLYILSRIVIIYKTIQIFSLKKDGLFYFSLYLCAQEIMPLFMLYSGIVYLYNIIEMNALWR